MILVAAPSNTVNRDKAQYKMNALDQIRLDSYIFNQDQFDGHISRIWIPCVNKSYYPILNYAILG